MHNVLHVIDSQCSTVHVYVHLKEIKKNHVKLIAPAASVGLMPSTSGMIRSHSVLTAAGRKSSPTVITPDTSATSFNASWVSGSP